MKASQSGTESSNAFGIIKAGNMMEKVTHQKTSGLLFFITWGTSVDEQATDVCVMVHEP